VPRTIYQNPKIEIEEETFTHGTIQRLRVVKLRGTLVRMTTTVQRDTSVPSYTMCHQGRISQDLRIPDTDGGHIMALSLGGVDIRENIAPMYSGFNRHGAWREKEREILAYLSDHSGDFRMCVEIQYQKANSGGDPRIPGAFRVWIEDSSGKAKIKPEILTMIKDKAVQMVLNTGSANLITQAQLIIDGGWRLEQELVIGSSNPRLPGLGVARPYAVLDYLDFHQMITTTVFGNGRPFTPQQRENILLVNRVRHNGWLVSDDTSENSKPLALYGDAGAEIDHIVPEAQSGCNAYSNARVVSSLLNKAKGTKQL
jgi:hypothetical protein